MQTDSDKRGTNLTVVLIDDDSQAAKQWLDGVAHTGLSIDAHVTAGAQEAVELAREIGGVDVVFAAVDPTPGSTELEIIEGIDCHGRESALVLVSPEESREIVQFAVSRQVEDFITKGPFYEFEVALHLRAFDERHQLRHSLEDSLESYRELFNLAPMPMLIVEPETAKVTQVNREATLLLNRSSQSVVGLPLNDLVVEQEPTPLLEQLREFCQRGAGIIDDLQIQPMTAQPIQVELHCQVIRLGRRDALQITVREPTEDGAQTHMRRRITELIHQGEKMAALGQMVAGVAHELNNPMSVINGLTLLLLEEEALSSYHEDLNTIAKSISRCATIVEDLVKFARIHEPDMVPLSLNEIAETTATMHLPRFEQASKKLLLELDPSVPISHGDSSLLSLVCSALITNAYEAITKDECGSEVRVTTHARPGSTLLKVFNDGPPIAPEIRSRIFDPFFSTKGVGQGTGLGLSYSYGIIKQHFGEIRVETYPDRGTEFIVMLPLIASDGMLAGQ